MSEIESRISKFIEKTEVDKQINLKNLLLVYKEKPILKFTKSPYNFDDKQLLFSMSKSFTSIAIGIAEDKDYLSIENKIIDYFPNDLPKNVSENLGNIKIKHLLTMSSGLNKDMYTEISRQKNWIKAFFEQDFNEFPNDFYLYNTHSTYVLSAIIEKSTGLNTLEFLNEYLFKPLDILKPEWEKCSMGIIAGGMGLSLSIEDIAKVGIMLINDGVYEGKRILSKAYLDKATRPQISKRTGLNKMYGIFSGDRYGFQFHIGYNDFYRLDGAFGQLCLIAPKYNIVIIATSTNTEIEKLLEYIYEYLLFDYGELKQECIIKNIPDSTLNFFNVSSNIPKLYNTSYNLCENINGFKKILISQNYNKLFVNIINSNNENFNLKFDFTKPVRGKGLFINDLELKEQKYISYARWDSSKSLYLKAFYIETPYIVDIKLDFFDIGKLKMEFGINVSFTLKNFETIGISY